MNYGTACAALAFVLWGVFPAYFRLLSAAPAIEVLMNRVVWSLALLLLILAARHQWAWLGRVLRQPRTLGAFAASSLLLSGNWLTYIWAVNHGHVVDASLGYFITPLVNVLLGYTLLHERPRRAQWLALALAGAGVLWLTALAGHLPWIALVLAATFGAYGLLRKVAVLGPLEGLALETLLLAPVALAALGLWWGRSSTSFPAPDLATNLWLIGLGPVTAVPLLLFAAGSAAPLADHARAAAVPVADLAVRARRVAVPRAVLAAAPVRLRPDLAGAAALQRRRLARRPAHRRRGLAFFSRSPALAPRR